MNHEKNKINWGIYNFQVTFEDEDVTHLQDPDTGEINKVKCADKRRPRPRVDKVKPKA